MEKQSRLNIIRDLIKNNNIRNQEQLQALLKKRNIRVTQATLSRDLKMLKAGKVHSNEGGYCYSALYEGDMRKVPSETFTDDVSRGFISLGFSGNIGVLRTLPGYASTAALAFDNLEIDEILGTVAGDDTVLFVIKEGTAKEKLIEILRKKFPSLYI